MTEVVKEVCALLQACFSKCSVEELAAVMGEKKENMSVREESVCGNEGGFLLCLMCVEHVSEGCVESLKQPLGQNGDVLTVLQSFVSSRSDECD